MMRSASTGPMPYTERSCCRVAELSIPSAAPPAPSALLRTSAAPPPAAPDPPDVSGLDAATGSEWTLSSGLDRCRTTPIPPRGSPFLSSAGDCPGWWRTCIRFCQTIAAARATPNPAKKLFMFSSSCSHRTRALEPMHRASSVLPAHARVTEGKKKPAALRSRSRAPGVMRSVCPSPFPGAPLPGAPCLSGVLLRLLVFSAAPLPAHCLPPAVPHGG